MKGQNNCVHNTMVECAGDFRPCYKCGWNPTVYEERVKKAVKAKKPAQKGIKI